MLLCLSDADLRRARDSACRARVGAGMAGESENFRRYFEAKRILRWARRNKSLGLRAIQAMGDGK